MSDREIYGALIGWLVAIFIASIVVIVLNVSFILAAMIGAVFAFTGIQIGKYFGRTTQED